MKKYLKVMLVLIVALSMFCTFAMANSFNVQDKVNVDSSSAVTTSINNIGATVIKIVQTVGYVVAVVMVLIVGIQWLVGTPAKKQELKGRMINVVIGAVLIIGGVTLLGMIEKFVTDSKASIVGGGSTNITESSQNTEKSNDQRKDKLIIGTTAQMY